MFSNAGYGLIGAAEEVTDDGTDRQLTPTCAGRSTSPAALPLLRAQGGGWILQTSTVGGQVVFPGSSLYHAAKSRQDV
jgi:NADP-dependent 3-hydroxy acid dehydrogenase YdfG